MKLYTSLTIFLLLAVSALSAAGQTASCLETQREDHIFAANGTDELVKCYSKSAIVRLPDDPDAEAAINAALTEAEVRMMEQCRGTLPDQEDAQKQITGQGDGWRPLFTLEMRSELTPQRISGGVISFETVDYMFSGGAHGMYGVSGRTFDTRTGKELTLADLSDRPALLREECVTEMVRQGLKLENLWFTTAEELRPMMEAIADRESWYLTDEGIVFHSDPYELAPYSEGALEFLVPYGQLPEMKY